VTQNEAEQLKAGERVAIDYLGERHEVEVVHSTVAHRWGELVTVRFTSGAVVATHYQDVRHLSSEAVA